MAGRTAQRARRERLRARVVARERRCPDCRNGWHELCDGRQGNGGDCDCSWCEEHPETSGVYLAPWDGGEP